MTPAPISVDRLRELLALATPSTRWVVTCDGFSIVTDDEPMHRSHVASCVEPDDAALIAEAITALPALLHQLAELKANLAELRQACWEARAVLGFDNDGDPTPDALVYPSLADLVRRDAAEFRKDYDEACNEAHAAERAREGLQAKLDAMLEVGPILSECRWFLVDMHIWPLATTCAMSVDLLPKVDDAIIKAHAALGHPASTTSPAFLAASGGDKP